MLRPFTHVLMTLVLLGVVSSAKAIPLLPSAEGAPEILEVSPLTEVVRAVREPDGRYHVSYHYEYQLVVTNVIRSIRGLEEGDVIELSYSSWENTEDTPEFQRLIGGVTYPRMIPAGGFLHDQGAYVVFLDNADDGAEGDALQLFFTNFPIMTRESYRQSGLQRTLEGGEL